jgi:hypothetical protein
MDQVAQTLAAGLSGDLGDAQRAYNDTVADGDQRIAALQEKLAGLNAGSRDYKTTLADLNAEVATQNQRQLDAAAALDLANKQFVFQQAAATLDAQGQLALAFSMGMIDEKSYNASLRVIGLTESFDANHDGVVSATEGQDKYINALTHVAQTADGTTVPAVNNYRQSLNDAETAMGGAYTAAITLKSGIEQIPDKTVTVTTNYVSRGSPGGGGVAPPIAYADGGPVAAGTYGVMNEDPSTRPETFVAGKPGYVLTRQDAQAALAGNAGARGGDTYVFKFAQRGPRLSQNEVQSMVDDAMRARRTSPGQMQAEAGAW